MKPISQKQFALVAVSATLLVLGALLNLSWLKWTDILIDSGRELYLPLALLQGKILYKDIFYIYGPFSPYFNALLYKLFGVSPYVLASGGVATTLCVTATVFFIAKIFLGRWLALFCALSFLILFPLGNYSGAPIFNYLIPYSYPATHSLLFSLLALYFFHRGISEGKGKNKLLYQFFLFLTVITKVEISLWLGISLLLGHYLVHRERGETPGKSILKSVKPLLPPLLLGAAVYLGFNLLGSAGQAQSNFSDTALSNLLLPKKSFASQLFSHYPVATSLLSLGLQMVRDLLFGGILLGGGVLFSRLGKEGEGVSGAQYAAAGAALAVSAAVVGLLPGWNIADLFRPVPLYCAAGALLGAAGWWKRGLRNERIMLAALGLFGVLMLLRMLLNVAVGSFGFYLLVPGFLFYQVLVFRVVPDMVGRDQPAKFLKGGFLLLVVGMLALHMQTLVYNYGMINSKIETDRGTYLFKDGQRVENYKLLHTELSSPRNKGKTLVAFPEGLWINYATGLENPLYFYQYLPIDLPDEDRVHSLIDAIDRARPDYFLLTDRKVREYGAESLATYANTLLLYLQDNYDLVGQLGENIYLAKRKPFR